MGHENFSGIVFLLGLCCYIVSCQNAPGLDWQFDPFSTDQWFKQKLDHYDSSNIQNWPQRYVTSYRFYRLGGPIFLFLSGPGPELTLTDIETGAIAEYAEEQGAFVIGLEHRFYGKSRPTSDLTTSNLNFLTIPQTIEDIAAFIRSWRGRDEFRNSKWVLFGASYLGSLAAWFAQKHPELIDAFVASSAPLELRYEIPEFLENVGLILNETNPKCYDVIAEGFSCLAKVFNEEDCQNYSLNEVKEKFDFCADMDRSRPFDATGVFAEIFSTINAVVMYHDPSPDSFPDTNLDRFCKHITVEGKRALDKIGEKVREINKHRGVPCAEFRFETTVDFLKEKEWDSPAAKEGYRQLQWQLCNELGWTVASANISQPFGNYLTPFLHSEICQNLFGLTETEMRLKVLKANTDLKGKALNTKCGIFVNGDKDPWHTFSITTPKEAGTCNRAILIEGGSHGRDVEDFTNAQSYPPQVRQAQVKIGRYLDSWLKLDNCCDQDPAESQRVISSLSRPARAPNPRDYYYAFNNLLKEPNVEIKPHAYPADNGGRHLAPPTSLPYQVSTTDVLSVSPRIPVGNNPIESQTQKELINGDIYRDPRNVEFRRYRVVKLLRHRHPFATTPSPEPNVVPSMEQFEADFPEHSLRVEGRVERVFKNGTVISSREAPNSSVDEQVNDQIDMFGKGRRLLNPTIPSNEITASPSSVPNKGNTEEENVGDGFKYVVKQIFKDFVSAEGTNNETQQSNLEDFPVSVESSRSASYESEKDISNSPKKSAKREQSLEDMDIDKIQEEINESKFLSSDNNESDEGSLMVNSSEEASESSEETSELSEGSSEEEKSSSLQKRESVEQNRSKKSNENDSDVTSESIEHVSILPKQPIKPTNTPESKGKNKSEEEEDDSYEDDDEDEYYDDDDDDDEYSDEVDSDEHQNSVSDNLTKRSKASDKHNSKFGKMENGTVRPVALNSKKATAKPSTEFNSGEDGNPKRLREKISEKIMSSSETIEDDHKSNEKSSSNNNKNQRKERNGSKSIGRSKESLEDINSSQSSFEDIISGEDYNYSLEPSGSDPQGSFRKKQLAPITKPVVDEPSTVIKVEISGSYPKISHHRKKSKKTTTETPKSVETQDPSMESTKDPQIEKPTRRRKVHRKKKDKSRRFKTGQNATDASNQFASTTTTTSTTTTSSTTSTTVVPDLTEQPPTNNYASWNRGRFLATPQASPVQQEAPTIINLEGGTNTDDVYPTYAENNALSQTPNSNNNNDVVYIIIGDIPLQDNENMVNENPSPEALFNFIQRLVNRHNPSILPNQGQSSYVPPTRPPTTTTTTTASPPVVSNRGFYDHTGKYLLVRPVQVVSLGREHVVHANDLKNESLIDLMTMETPHNLHTHTYPYQSQVQNMKRQDSGSVGGYGFKSPMHRDHFERLLSVDGQVRDSDRDIGYGRHNLRRLDQIPDPSWRSIRGVSQFGPVVPPQQNNQVSGLLSLSAADTMWVNEGVPFIPRNKQLSERNPPKNIS